MNAAATAVSTRTYLEVALGATSALRAPALPSDLAALTSASPLELTLLAWGGPARVQRARTAAIRDMIAETLASNGEA